VAKEARRLILETEQHGKPADPLSQIVYDLDMGVLNDPLLYHSYAEGVRKEYEPLFKE
jgi:predicted metal-dependent HD superfamily phosphohydrolase